METRGRGRKSASRIRSRDNRASHRTSPEGVRTRGRAAAAAAAAATTTTSAPLSSSQIAPSEITPAVSEVASIADSTTTQTPANPGAESFVRRRRTRRHPAASSSNRDSQLRQSRRTRRRRDSSALEAGRLLRSRPKASEDTDQSSTRPKNITSREAASHEVEVISRPRRPSRKRPFEDNREQAFDTSGSKQNKRSSKRQRRDSVASGTSVTFRESSMDQEEENGDNGSHERDAQNMASRNVSGIQGLLRRLGAGLDELFPMAGSNSGRFRQILSVLRTSTDDVQRLDALTQLCDVLSVGTEESMVSFSVDSFVPPLVAVLSSGSSPELMLLAARALTHMMDALPSSASSIAQNGAAAPLCANLISIEFMDLAEQSLSALEKMSVDYPQSIVRAGGFAAALSFIDFFQSGVKRVAVSLACNLCRNPPSESVGLIVDVLPVMMTLLDSEDQRIRQSVIQGFARLAESFRSNSERLETFCGADLVLIDKIVLLVCTNPSITLTPASYSAALRLLSVLARGSAKLASKELSSELLITTLRDIFDSGRALHAMDALQLTDALLPEASATQPFEEYFPRRRRRHSSSTMSAYAAVDAIRRDKLHKNPEPLSAFGRILFGSLVRFCNASANAAVRRVVLLALSKFIELAPPPLLSDLLLPRRDSRGLGDPGVVPELDENFPAFIAGLLGENSSHQENLIGLCLVEAALRKLKQLKIPFFREGVMYALGRLVSKAEKNVEEEKEEIEDPDSKTKKGGKNGEAEVEGHSRAIKKISKDVGVLIAEKAKKLMAEHSEQGEETSTSCLVLNELGAIQKRLSHIKDDKELEDTLKHFFQVLCDSGGVSNFELSQSGLVETLVDTLASEKISDAVRSKRATLFTEAIAGLPNQSLAVSLLATRILGVLAAEENLSIFINESSSSNSTSMASGLRQLAQPFKLRLRRAPDADGGDKLRHYSHHVVLIEPLATMSSVQDFLWSRVRPLPSSSSSGGAPRSPDASNDDEAGADEDEEEGNDSNSDRAATHGSDEGVFEVTAEIDSNVHEDEDEGENMDENASGSGSDEEMIDDEEDEEEDVGDATSGFAGSDQMSRSLPPLDVDHDLLARSPTRRPLPAPTLGFRAFSSGSGIPRSYAAAVTNEFRRSRKNGDETDPMSGRSHCMTQKLTFTMNGHPVSHDSSILQAVLSSTSRGEAVKPRMWEEVHTLTYGLAPPEAASRDENTKEEENPREGLTRSKPSRRSRRLRGNGIMEQPDSRTLSTHGRQESEHNRPSSKREGDDSSGYHVPKFTLAKSIPRPTSTILKLLMYVHWIVQNAKMSDGSSIARLSVNDDLSFKSQKLTAKLMRQLSDPLALCGGAIPEWCEALARDVPFLVPFETRRILFHSTSLGVARALNLLQARSDASSVNGSSSLAMGRSSSINRDTETRIGRIQRQKVRVHRNRLLESAMRVMYMYGAHKTVLEVEYFDEVGTGLGPTLEFYTLVSRELQRTKLGLWRTQEVVQSVKVPDEKKLVIGKSKTRGKSKTKSVFHKYRNSSQPVKGKKRSLSKRMSSAKCPVVRNPGVNRESQYVVPTGTGLYPACLPRDEKASKKVLEHFEFVGRLVAKALSDGRLLDLRFCTVFTKLIMAHARALEELEEKEESCDVEIDDKMLLRFFPIDTIGMSMLQKVDSRLAKSLQAILGMVENDDDDIISSLCLNFTVPGHADVELVHDGMNKEVTKENAEIYVSKVLKYVLYVGVKQQAAAFMVGFSEVLDSKSLLLFQENEVEVLMCGPSFEKWNKEYLIRATRCDHGYRHESPAVGHLLRAMSELNAEDQRRFLQFVTGSPALPVGGLIGLHPRLIIVKRTAEDGRSPDECLPTVMTCTNYLKLPDYSSFEICKERLYYAIREGQGCFHLS